MLPVILWLLTCSATALRLSNEPLGPVPSDGSNEADLWEGLDVISNFATSSSKDSAGSKAPRLQILGIFDSGTHLFQRLAEEAFTDFLFHPGEWRAGPHKRGLWKHTPMRPGIATGLHKDGIDAGFFDGHVSDVHAVAMVRNPFSSRKSLLKAPYALKQCKEIEVIRSHRPPQHQQCMVECGKYRWTQLYKNHGCPWTFHNLTDAYNEYMHGYFEVLPRIGFKSVTIMPYERLVLDPQGELRRLANSTGLQFKSDQVHIYLPEKPAKGHGRSRGRDAAVERIQNRTYLQEYAPSELQYACATLNRGALKDVPEYVAEFDKVCLNR